jgi:predicted metal-dependent phosphoesterase TrpH
VRIDLHTHSTASDGTRAPSDVMADAARAGLDVVALTDHDTTTGWDEAADAARRVGVVLVPGAEVSCHHAGISIHVLSYLHDPAAPGLLAETSRSRDSRMHRAQRIVEHLAQDYDLTWADVLEQVGDGATIGRPHIADALVAKGLFASRDDVFATVLHDGSRYYVGHYAPEVCTAVRLIREAGGVPVFAHPLAGRRGRTVGEDVTEAMVDAGLAGLEVDHRDHDPDSRRRLRELARSHGLLVTGSSDYHGEGKPNVLGEHVTAPEVFEALVAQGRGTGVVRP